jgi:hypothetical protein
LARSTIAGAGIDQPLNAATAKEIVLRRGGDTDHPGADDRREIDGRETDSARGGMDQYRLVRVQAPHDDDQLVRSEIGDGQRRALREVEISGQCENLLLRGADVA